MQNDQAYTIPGDKIGIWSDPEDHSLGLWLGGFTMRTSSSATIGLEMSGGEKSDRQQAGWHVRGAPVMMNGTSA